MSCRWGFVLLAMCMAPLPGHALAKEIVMTVTTSVTVTKQSVDIRLEVGNKGNENSRVVIPFLTLAGVATGLEAAPYIAYGGEQTWVHSFPVSDLLVPEAGAYPLVVRLRYHDTHMYPHSMVSVTSVQIGESLPLKVSVTGEMVAEQLSDEGTLDLRVRNTGTLPLDARLTMVSPTELIVTGDSGTLDIPAGEEQQVSYAIKNNGALPGSSQTVHAVIEYSIHGQHGVVILEEGVVVAKYSSNKKRRMIIASAGFIVLLFISILFIEFRAGATAA